MEQNPTKKCSQCQMDISSQAKKCPHCQSKVKQPVSKLTTVIVIFFAIIIFSGITISSSTQNSTPQPEPTVEGYKSRAKVFAELYVERILKSPSTADFCRGSVVDLGNNRYEISSCVDSQNSFGAMLRSNWEAVIVYKGGDPDDVTNWTIEKLIFDGETIY